MVYNNTHNFDGITMYSTIGKLFRMRERWIDRYNNRKNEQ